MPVSAAITFRMAMGSGYVAVMRGTPVTPYSCLRKARWDVGVVTGVYCPPRIAG